MKNRCLIFIHKTYRCKDILILNKKIKQSATNAIVTLKELQISVTLHMLDFRCPLLLETGASGIISGSIILLICFSLKMIATKRKHSK